MIPLRRVLAAVVITVTAAVVSPVAVDAQDPDLTVEVVDRSPWVDVGGTLTVDVSASEAVETLSVQVHGRLESPDELAASRQGDEGPVIFTGEFPVADAAPVAGGAVRFTFDISDTVNEGTTMRMAYAGVYPLVITPLDAEGTAGDPIRTPVIRRSGAGTTLPAVALSLVVDVSTTPTATADGSRRPFTPDELARFTRLTRFLRQALQRELPITVLVNTDTFDALAISGEVAATDLHAVLRRPGLVVVPQPTVPLDWPVLEAAGLDDMIGNLVDRGRLAVADVDGRVDETVWDATGGVDTASMAAIADAGFSRILVTPDGSAVPDGGLVPRDVEVPDAPDGLDVVAVDTTTADALSRSTAASALDALADLVLRTSDDVTAAIVVDDVVTGSVLDIALDLLADPDSPATVVDLDSERGPLSPLTPTGPDLVDMREMTDLASQISGAARSLALYESITDDAEAAPVVTAASDMLAGTVQRDLDRAERTLLLAGITELTSWVTDQITFVGPGDLNLTSRTGTLPIGVVNDGATSVQLTLAARSDRLRFPDGETRLRGGIPWTVISVDVVPGESRLDLPVEALASGSVPLFVELRAPDGSVVVPVRQYNVRSTAVSGVGMVLSIGALVVLVVWWFRTWRRTRDQSV